MCHPTLWTNKRKRIEHKLFSFISQNRRGIPLIRFTTIIVDEFPSMLLKPSRENGELPCEFLVGIHTQ